MRDHRPDRDVAGHRPRRVDGEAMHCAPALSGDLLGRRGELAARVVDQCVDPAEPLERAVDQVAHCRVVPDVGGHRERPCTQRLDLRGGLLRRLTASAADHDIGAAAGQVERDGPPDAGAAAGHQRDCAAVDTLAQYLGHLRDR